MPEKKSTTSRGGAREGAGRKAKLIDPVTKQIRLEQAMVEEIEAMGHEVSTFLREAGEEKLARARKKKGAK